MPERSNRMWKILFCIFMAATVVGLMAACVRIYGQVRVEAELEQLAEATAGGAPAAALGSAAQGTGSGAAQGAGSAAAQAADNAPGSGGASGAGTASGLSARDSCLQALMDRGVPIPEKEIDFGDLQTNVNKDIYAWIYIPDTQIDYPILQHPTDNLYYLNYNLDGSRGYPGCIYTEDYNTKDFSDPNTVVYGHNMKNGTMFAGLHRFEDSEYFEEHPYVYIYTEDGLYAYEIFAAYESGNEHILYNNDFESNYVYQKYLSEIFDNRTMNGNIKTDMEVTTENHILTLSTCVANKSDRRYLVQGVLLEAGAGGESQGETMRNEG